jgi:hypothetical protein
VSHEIVGAPPDDADGCDDERVFHHGLAALRRNRNFVTVNVLLRWRDGLPVHVTTVPQVY